MKNSTIDYGTQDYQTTDCQTTGQRAITGQAQLLTTALALTAVLLGGCTGPGALKGGRAFTGRTAGGAMSQALLQGENPSAPSRQAQETVRVRTYTVPAGTSFPPFQYSNIPFLASTNTPSLQYSSHSGNSL